jgi:hypothetical protein
VRVPVELPAGGPTTVGLKVAAPEDARPGSSFIVHLVQRTGSRIVGGVAVEVRIPGTPWGGDVRPVVRLWRWLGVARRRSSRQFAVAAAGSGLMWANMLRPFQLGKARTSHEGPWSWIRESRVASSQDNWPACHFTNASASAVM